MSAAMIAFGVFVVVAAAIAAIVDLLTYTPPFEPGERLDRLHRSIYDRERRKG